MQYHKQNTTVRALFIKGQPLSFSRGQIIIGNDNEPDGIYYIDSGYIKVYSISKDGGINTRIIFGSGEVFPLTWAYLGISNDELYYETLSDCVLWRISRRSFLDIINEQLAHSKAMALQLARQTDIFTKRLENLEYHTATERVVYRVLYLASRFGIRKKSVIKIEAPITHEIFASTVNLSRESVSRELEKLGEEKLIRHSKRVISILDVNGLVDKLDRPINLSEWHLT